MGAAFEFIFEKKDSLLYLACWHPESSGYEYRVNKWAEELRKKKIKVKVLSVFQDKAHATKLLNGSQEYLLLYWMRVRFWQILSSVQYEQVIVRRTLLLYNEYGDLFFERLLLSIHPSAILDIDDDLERAQPSASSSIYGYLLLENRNKFKKSLKLYHRFIVGSAYLQSLVEESYKGIGLEIALIPTCVDYHLKYPAKQYGTLPEQISFGWIGSDGNQHYLDRVIDSLNTLHQKLPIKLIVISGKEYKNKTANFKIINYKWSLNDEIDFLKLIDVGLMPLTDSKMERGKCGFKILQYMGLGIVPIADAVGANKEIIQAGSNGYLIHENNWEKTLTGLVSNWGNLNNMSKNALNTVNQHYSFNGNLEEYLKFLGKKPR